MGRISSVNSLEGFHDLLKSLRGQCGSRPDCRDANKEANGNSHRDDLAGANLVNVESKARPINQRSSAEHRRKTLLLFVAVEPREARPFTRFANLSNGRIF